MPFKPRRPAGGFRIMYEYANRLSLSGYSVHLIYPLKTQFMKYRWPYWVRLLLSYIEGFRTNKWFKFNPKITMKYVPSIADKYVPNADIIFVTWWATVLEVGNLSPSKGKKINLIQGFENWEGHIDLLYSSYDIPNMVNVVVADYLKDIVAAHTQKKTVQISNSVDGREFHISTPINTRKNTTVCMLHSIQEIKGSKYGIEALKIVKQKFPELTVQLFGICPEPKNLPDWMTFQRNPQNLCGLFNENAIFVTNSLTEGFSLLPVEAMLCGCASVCTNISGHKEYAINKETALLVEPENPEEMAEKISFLISNNSVRIELACKGSEYVQRFSWDSAMGKMNTLLSEVMENRDVTCNY